MTKLNFSILSEDVLIDQATNNVSILNQIEQLNAPSLPVAVQKMVILAAFERDGNDESIDVKISVVLPSGKSTQIAELPVKFQGKKRARLLARLNGFPIQEFGTHCFVLMWEAKPSRNKGKAEISLEVERMHSEKALTN
jgi:hypothetical protein